MLQLKCGFMNEQSTNLAWKNVETLIHSQQQPQGPKTHKNKSIIQLTIRITMICAPSHKGPFFTGSWFCLKSSASHTLGNKFS